MLKKYIKILFLSALFLTPSCWVCAQMLSGEQTLPVSENKEKPSNMTTPDEMTPEEEKQINEHLQKKVQPKAKQDEKKSIFGKTIDGSKRGTVAFVAVPDKNGKVNEEDNAGHIFLYYGGFKINRSHIAGVGCQVRFKVLTTLDRRLANLSVKLIWPGMTTNLSFNNVNPNIENYFDYALFGQGCYKMDKIPNIVVNRCRAKGMSQEECARKIRWLSKSKK